MLGRGIIASALRKFFPQPTNVSYIMGGAAYTSSVRKIDAAETVSLASPSLTSAKGLTSSVVSPSLQFYLIGGHDGVATLRIAQRYGTASWTSIGSMNTARRNAGAVFGRINSYVIGGVSVSSTEKLSFSTETFSLLATGGSSSQPCYSTPDFGILAGGLSGATNSTNHQSIYRFNYSTESFSLESSYSSALGTIPYSTTSGGNRTNGYFNTGGTAVLKYNIYTKSASSINLDGVRRFPTTLSRTDGTLICGGYDGTNPLTTSVKINYSTDTYSSSVSLGTATYQAAGVSL